MATIKNDVKQIILEISGLDGDIDGLSDDSTLSDLGFNDTMCRELAQRLDAYVKSKKLGTSIGSDDITTDMTVAEVVALVIGLLA